MNILTDNFKGTVEKDLFMFLCGERLGHGSSREVFVCEMDPRYVIKIENVSKSFQNVSEWHMWCDAEALGTEVSRWLAPCKTISSCGTILMQRRTKPAKNYPKKVPAFFTDLKEQNFGMLGGKFVCHDYGFNRVTVSGLSLRMRKATWWRE